MKSLKIIFFLLFLTITINFNGYSQLSKTKIFVRNNIDKSISIKWYTSELVYPEGVNIYRREKGTFDWVKLNLKPVKLEDSIPKVELANDKDLDFFVSLIKESKRSDLQGFLLLNVLVKSFESPVFSKFLGILYKDEAAEVGKSYEYKVMKLQKGSEVMLGISNEIIVGSDQPLEAIKGLKIVADSLKAKISWTPEEERFYGVNIYKTSSVQNTKIKLNNHPIMVSKIKDSLGKYTYPKVMFRDDSLKEGVKYSYELTGVDFFGKETLPTMPFEIFIKDVTPPAPPSNLKDSVNNLTVILNWKNGNGSDIAGINIYRSNKSDGPYFKINTNLLYPNTTSFTDKVSKVGPYYYYVASADFSGNEGKCEKIYVEVHDIVPPSKPLMVLAKGDTAKIVLTWQKNTEKDLKGYLIFRSVNKSDKEKFVLLNSEPISINHYIDKLPKNAKNNFIYKIVAIDSSFNKSIPSEIAKAKMPDIVAPIPPYLKEVQSVEKYIIVNWLESKDGDLKGYNLYKSNYKNSGFAKINNKVILAKTTTYKDENIIKGINYYYYLTAIDSSGNESGFSNIINGLNNNPGMTGKSLSGVKIKVRKEHKDVFITLKGDKDNEFEGYVIFRREGEKGRLIPLTGKIHSIDYSDKDIKEGSTYAYEIRAYTKIGEVVKSEIIKINIEKF